MFFGKIKNTDNEWGFDVFETTFESYIEIDDNTHMSIVEQANAQQKLITGDENGQPILVDPPAPTPEEIARQRIDELESYLTSTDWYAIRYADTGVEVPADIKQQRQLAREEISTLRESLGK